MDDFRILGPLEVVRDGATVDLGGPKQRTLLAVLLLHANTVLPRARLIEALWGESAPPTAQASLRNLVSHLRRVLGGERVESTAAGYAVRVGADELDATRFERLVGEVDSPARARVARLREGLDLWRGPPLPDCALDHDELAEPGPLEELRLTALETWLEARVELGDTDAVVSELQPLVVRHPLRERLWYQLMLSLYRAGRQAEALATYRRAHEAFAEELGLDPGAALKELQRAILIQDPSLDGRRPGDDLFQRAVEELAIDERSRAQALFDYAVAVARLGERRRADAALDEAVRRARRVGDPVLEQRALLERSLNSHLVRPTTLRHHEERAREAIAVFSDAGDDAALADALVHYSYMLRDSGRAAQAAAAAAEAREAAARSGNVVLAARAAGYEATALAIGPVPVSEALARCAHDSATAPDGVLLGCGYLSRAGRGPRRGDGVDRARDRPAARPTAADGALGCDALACIRARDRRRHRGSRRCDAHRVRASGLGGREQRARRDGGATRDCAGIARTAGRGAQARGGRGCVFHARRHVSRGRAPPRTLVACGR